MGNVNNVCVGGVHDPGKRSVHRDDDRYGSGDEHPTLELTKREQEVLDLLPATAREIALALYNYDTRSELNCVYVYLHELRRKGVPIAKRRVYSKKRRRYVKQFYVKEEDHAISDR